MSFAPARLALVLSLCAILVAGSALALSGDVGTPAPDFDLQIFQLGGGGGNFALSEQAGKVVVMFVVGYG
ncbi:MAG: hypothetical protein QNL91_05185 [Candidatus Krumholzibacteria bacterium]|nr:hypothetical protein [Candidatus Krumholzibacteria bacterium]